MTAPDRHDAAERGGAPSDGCDLLADAMAAGEVGVWRWDAVSGRLTWSQNLQSVHPLPVGFDGSLESFGHGVHPQDRDRLLAEIEAAMDGGDRFTIEYRLHSNLEDKAIWVEARGRVVRDPSGQRIALTGICQDITDHKNTEAELALRARQHEAVFHLGEKALAGSDQVEVFGEAVKLVAELVSADAAEILEVSHERGSLSLRAAHGWRDDLVGQPTATSEPDSQAGFTLRAEGPVRFSDINGESRFKLSETAESHGVLSGASVTIGGKDGMPFGVLAVYCFRPNCVSDTDVRFLQSVANVLGSAIRAAQDHERSELLIGELRHRVGNLFSLVQALHRQTGQNAQDAQDLEMKFGARLAALAGAHSLILEGGWHRTSVRSLLETTLAPYKERVVYSGTDVRMPADAAFSFSMALHELATNANKYGALGHPNGRLCVETRSAPDPLGDKLILVWKESDGPPPPEAEGEGFGSKLITQVVERQLGGNVTRAVERDGLRISIEFPIR